MRYELKPRTIGEILDGAFALYRNHFVELLQIVMTVTVPVTLVRLAVVHAMTGVWALEYVPQVAGSEAAMEAGMKMLSVVGISLPLVMLAYSIQGAALTSAVSDLYLGRPLNPWGRTASAMPALLMAGFLSGMGVGLAFLLFVVPGIILALRWSLSAVSIVVEGRSAMEGLARSRTLVKGRSGKVAAVMFLVFLLTMVITAGILLLIPKSLKAVPLVPQLIQLALTALVVPWGQAAMVLLYFDARIEKEALDLEMLAADMSKPASTAPVAAPQG